MTEKQAQDGFVAVSRFTIANGLTAEVKQAFKDRPGLVEDTPGFVKLDVISPIQEPDQIWLLTYWQDEASYTDWHRGHTYKDAHKGIPKGLKLVPKSAQVLRFDHICS